MDQSFEDGKKMKRSTKKRSQGNTQILQSDLSVASIANLPTVSNTVSQAGNGAVTVQSIPALPGSVRSTTLGDQGAAVIKGVEKNSSTTSPSLVVHEEMIEYVNKLEYLVVSTRLKLLRERKAYSQILSSLALFFDSKGISSSQVEDYVNSVVEELKTQNSEDNFDYDNEQLDWMSFLHEKRDESLRISQGKQDNNVSSLNGPLLGSAGNNVISGPSNVLPINNTNNFAVTNGSTLHSQSSVKNPATTSLSTSGSVQQVVGSGGSNIIRLQMNNSVQEDVKLKAPKLMKKPAATIVSNSTGKTNISSGVINGGNDMMGEGTEEPKTKKKKRIDSNNSSQGGSYVDVNGLQSSGSTLAAQQAYAIQNQHQILNYSYLQQQQQQEKLYQQFMQAQHNQMLPPMINEQMMQQMLLSYQQKQNIQ